MLSLTLAMTADHVREGIRQPRHRRHPWVTRLLIAADDPKGERAALDARRPLGRLVTADETAAAVVYPASPAAASVTGIARRKKESTSRRGDRDGAEHR